MRSRHAHQRRSLLLALLSDGSGLAKQDALPGPLLFPLLPHFRPTPTLGEGKGWEALGSKALVSAPLTEAVTASPLAPHTAEDRNRRCWNQTQGENSQGLGVACLDSWRPLCPKTLSKVGLGRFAVRPWPSHSLSPLRGEVVVREKCLPAQL